MLDLLVEQHTVWLQHAVWLVEQLLITADWLKGLVKMLLDDCCVLQSQMGVAATLRIFEPINAIKSSTAFGLLCTSKRCIDWATVQKQAMHG